LILPTIRDRGFALVSVLWGISILSLIASAMLTDAVVSRHLERNAWWRTRAEALAQAGVNRAVVGLMDARADVRWRIDAVPQTLSFGGADITISIEDELGKIDLNATDGDTLRRLFESAGADKALASALAARTLDWRTSEVGHSLNGASADSYRTAGLSYKPRGGAFQSVDELTLVLGMTPQLFERVAPALTVYSGRPFFDATVAPKEALLTFPGYDDAKVAEIIASRREGQGIRVSLPLGMENPSSSLAGRPFTVAVTVVLEGSRMSERQVIRLTGDPSRPYLVLELR
jgi:general secretion pathway protein K